MDATPDRFLNQLVVSALTIFILTIMLLAALVVRQMWLQQHVAALSDDVQERLEALEETTDELQDELLEIQAQPEQATHPQDWEGVTGVLDDVDAQLGAIGESIDEVALILEPQTETAVVPTAQETLSEPDQDQVDQVFTVFSALVALSSVAIAVLLALAIRVQQRSAQNQPTYIKPHASTRSVE